MKLTERLKLKNIICAVLAIAGLLALTNSSYAAYISQDAQRGVVRNRDTEAVRFSSNYLQLCNATIPDSAGLYNVKNILFSEQDKEKSELEIPVNIYNYSSGNANAVNENDIIYKLTFTIEGATDLSKYSVRSEKPAGSTYTQKNGKVEIDNMRLTGRVAAEHRYILTIPGQDLDKVTIKVVAEPKSLSATNQQKLAVVLVPGTQVSIPAFQCTGTFPDEMSGKEPFVYDAFNYEIAITSGRAIVELTWDSSLVELDKYFTEKLEERAQKDSSYYVPSSGTTQKSFEIATNGNKKTITFIMNQNKGTGDELIPFYIVNKTETDKMTWEQMKNAITVVGKQSLETE